VNSQANQSVLARGGGIKGRGLLQRNHDTPDKIGQNSGTLVDAETSSGGPDGIEGTQIELIEGINATRETLSLISENTNIEVVSFQVFGRLTRKQAETGRGRNGPMYDRGVTSRTIYLDGARNDKIIKNHVDWLNRRGSQVRTRPSLPMQMLISDQRTAVLPLDPSGQKVGIRVIRDPIIVDCLTAFFEQTWLSAMPLGLTITTKNNELTATQHTVIEMLALGYVDREIETKMAIDKRTVGRRVAEIMQILNAKTRFQAGAQAAKHGII